MIKIYKIINLKALISLLVVTILSSGCSVVGLGIGAAIDSGKEDYRIVEGKQLESVKPGMETIVNLTDGSQKKGNFAGLTVKLGDKDDVLDQTVAVPDSGIILGEYILANNTTDYEYISLRSIERIRVSNKSNLKYTFMAMGLLFDALIILGGGSYWPDPWERE